MLLIIIPFLIIFTKQCENIIQYDKLYTYRANSPTFHNVLCVATNDVQDGVVLSIDMNSEDVDMEISIFSNDVPLITTFSTGQYFNQILHRIEKNENYDIVLRGLGDNNKYTVKIDAINLPQPIHSTWSLSVAIVTNILTVIGFIFCVIYYKK